LYILIKKYIMENFEEIIKSKTPTLVDFYATWCGPCKMMSPLLEQVSQDVGDSARILKIDVDTNRNVATQYGIRSVPTLILFKEGKQVWRQSGVPPKNLIVESVNNFV
jgi:thioredoxin 1